MQKPKSGDMVRVRRARCRVVDIRPYDACQVLTLRGADHVERRVITPFDIVEPLDRVTGLRRVGRGRWRRACRDLLAANVPPGGLRSARQAQMDLLPHQLEPALAILRGLGSRVLLADDVGLGKTVQAGLVAAELRARGWADRILVLTPAGVRDQWAAELAARLRIDASIVDAAEVRRRVAALPVGVNPWTTVPVAIASMDYVKRAEVLPVVSSCRWDIVIVDEAHGVARDGDRFRAASALGSAAAYVLLLTATPHSGDRRAFASLCAIGVRNDDPLLVFRRTRRDVRQGAVRRVHRLHVRPTPAESHMHALLSRFTRAVRDEHGDRAALALSVLHKRALSSAHALARSVERRLATLDIGNEDGALQLALPLDDGCGELTPADEPPAWGADVGLADARRERRLLESLSAAARAASVEESKIRVLRRLLQRLAEPVVVFTEYRDTLVHLRDAIRRPAVLLHGGLTREERAAALAEFSSGACAVLLATDAAGEGLNLHHRCRFVVNLELPWNPMRLEQRIGRVDRIGQSRTVHAMHLVARDTGEPRILERLKARVARAQADIDAPDPIGGEERAIARLILGGTTGADDPGVDARPDPVAGCVPVRLERDALVEAARLANARAVGGADGIHADITAPWRVRTRHRKTRARLGNRTVVLLRATYEDVSGRVAESTLIALSVPGGRRTGTRGMNPYDGDRAAVSAGAEILDCCRDDLGRRAETASEGWRAEARAVADAFTATRLRREYAIASAAAARAVAAAQPGLFDRRAADAIAADAAAREDADAERRRRIADVERAATLAYLPPVLLLVLET
jgi:superfamily II DNA or RNA helicase